ncbi:MAG: hypothetical protein KDA57_05960 [Planctomycetales bacterium]|nr:hypothetical protein [Planctomycetales bacterium]
MLRITTLTLVAALAVAASQTQAALLFTRSLVINNSVNNFDTDQLDVDIVFADSQLNPTDPVSLFDDVVIDATSINQVFTRTASSANLAAAALRLQDGLNQFIRILLTENKPGGLSEKRGWSESEFFLHGTPVNAPDLPLATIDSIEIRVDQFQAVPRSAAAAAVPGGSGNPLNVQLQFSLFGTIVPEPSSGWLSVAGVAILSLLFFCRRRNLKLAKAAVTQRSR